MSDGINIGEAASEHAPSYAIAVGLEAQALATQAIAIGYGAHAEGYRSIAIGKGALAQGIAAVAIGDGAEAIGDGVVVIKNSPVFSEESVKELREFLQEVFLPYRIPSTPRG